MTLEFARQQLFFCTLAMMRPFRCAGSLGIKALENSGTLSKLDSFIDTGVRKDGKITLRQDFPKSTSNDATRTDELQVIIFMYVEDVRKWLTRSTDHVETSYTLRQEGDRGGCGVNVARFLGRTLLRRGQGIFMCEDVSSDEEIPG